LRYFGRAGEEGQAIVLVAICMMAMLFAIGLAIDSGTLFVAKRTIQEAADAAAFAGGVVLYQDPTKVTEAKAAAVADATLNGFTHGVNGVSVVVNSPPLSGAFQTSLYVEVLISQSVKTALVPAEATFNQVSARGVGGADPATSPYAVVLLKTAGPCLTISSSTAINIPSGTNLGGILQANCTGTSIQTGGVTITDTKGVRTVGTVDTPSNIVTAPATLTQNASLIPDPFGGFPKPTIGTIVSNSNYNVPNCSTPLQPGTYIGGITASVSCNILLAPGVYILKGGGFDLNSGQNVTSQAGGVFIFNTHSNYPAAKGAGTCGPFQAQSSGGYDLTAMTTGVYKGMVYYQDINCTNTIKVQSSGSFNFHGTVYAPSAKLDIQSSGTMTIDAQLVVSSINFQSSGTLTVNYHTDASAQSGLPTLVE
jgi:Flp pilus assembly protein TadG